MRPDFKRRRVLRLLETAIHRKLRLTRGGDAGDRIGLQRSYSSRQ